MRNKYFDEEGKVTEVWTQGVEKYLTKVLEGEPTLERYYSEESTTDYIVH